MRFKKLFPLITETNIEVIDQNGETILKGDPAAMTWDSVEEIKNLEIIDIMGCEDDGGLLIINIVNEKKKGAKK